MRALLLSAYAAQSHRYWQAGLQRMFPNWSWTALQLPPRHFSWRVRGNPLFWSIAERETLEAPWDRVIATSMVDLATLRGLVPRLASVPTLLYFHENQFAYPQDRQQHGLLEAQMVSLYGALAADSLAFNSRYNLDSFMLGCDELLQRLPDRVPPGIVEQLRSKAVVLPVPLLPIAPDTAPTPAQQRWRPGALRLLWSARFEHDKGGDGLLRLLQELEQGTVDYQLAVTGQQFRSSPAVFEGIRQEFSHRLVQFGYVDQEEDFWALQREADIVISTALHEFQGLAVMQAVMAGCVPVVPDRLAYRETYPAALRYTSCPEDPLREAQSAAELISVLSSALPLAPDVSAFGLEALREPYQATLGALQDSQLPPS